jgi:hypothetical protein
MYEQSAVRMDLMSQRSIDEMRRLNEERRRRVKDNEERWRKQWFVEGLDERWRIGT